MIIYGEHGAGKEATSKGSLEGSGRRRKSSFRGLASNMGSMSPAAESVPILPPNVETEKNMEKSFNPWRS